jgi:adenosylcobalamin-dependent ribonucleoside-triphosphate reductase
MQPKIRRFKLSEQFLDSYKNKQVPWGPVGYVTYKRTYARRLAEFDPSLTGTEEWWQTCRRVIEGMFNMQKQHIVSLGLEWNDAKAQRTAKDAYERLFVMKWTPPGRGLWMMGTKFVEERTAAGLFNCAFRSTKDLADKGGYLFRWMMDALMLGIGVGFDTLGAGTLEITEPKIAKHIHVIEDSREGWVESVEILLNGYLLAGPVPEFDYSAIRPYGAPINGFGGTSSGSAPLEQLHADIANLFSDKIGLLITSEDIVDIENLIGKCVVAGNVRRSAALAMGAADDTGYLMMKDPSLLDQWGAELTDLYKRNESEERRNELQELINNHPLRTHRWGSNNSIVATVGMDYTDLAKQSAKNGEPGYIWLDNARHYGRMSDAPRDDDLQVMGFNPCVEQQLEDAELCCLTETFPARHDSLEDYQKTLKIAYLYAKTVTLARTQWPETNQKMQKNRRIGLSQSGVQQARQRLGYRELIRWCREGYTYIQELDKKYSDWLCIPRSKRTTSIKPSGTVSLLNGSTPGIHFPEDEFYIRRINFGDDSEVLAALIENGYPHEPSAYSANTTVVSFPVRESNFSKGKREASMWEQLEVAAAYQAHWADNSVSVTVTFKANEAPYIKDALEMYEDKLKAVSFLRYSETGYVQAPYEAITQEQYLEMQKLITPIQRMDVSLGGSGTKFCDGESCEISWDDLTEVDD